MAKNRIRIDGDFSGISKGFTKITKEFKKLDKISLKIDDKDMKSFRKFSIDTFRKLEQDVDKYQAKLDKINKAKLLGNQTANQVKQEKILNSLLEKRTEEMKKQKDHMNAGNWIQRRGAKMQAGAQAGSFMDVAGGALGMMGGALGTAATGIGIAGGIYMGARALTAKRRALADTNLQFRGLNQRGITQDKLEEIRESGINAGFTAQEAMAAANSAQRNAGNVTGGKELETLLNMSKTTGMSSDELTGYASTFRSAAVNAEGAGLQQNLDKTKELYKQAMISALDTSGALKFMQTTAEMTEQVANEGSADTDSIKNTLTAMTLNSEFYKSNISRGTAAFKGGEGFYKSGEGTGLAMRAIQASGMGKGLSAPELLLMQKKGFTEQGGMGAEGLGAITKQLSSASAGLTPENWGRASNKQKATGALSIAQQFGISATNAEELQKQAMTGGLDKLSPEKIKELLTQEGKEYETKSISIQESIDMGIKQNEAQLEEMMNDIGDVITPAIVSIEKGIYKLVGWFTGKKSEQELQKQAEADRQAARESGGTFGQWIRSGLTGGSRELDRQESFAALGRKKAESGKDLSGEETDAMLSRNFTHGLLVNSDQKIRGLGKERIQSKYDNLVSDRDLINKVIETQTKEAEKIKDPQQRKHALAQLTNEREASAELTKAINRLVGFLGQQPVKKVK